MRADSSSRPFTGYHWGVTLLALVVLIGVLAVRSAWRDDGAIIRLSDESLVRGVAVSPDGGTLFAATASGLLRWALPARSPLPPLDPAPGFAVAVRPDGRQVAVVQLAGQDGLAVRLLATDASATALTLAEATPTTTIAWSLDGGSLAVADGPILQLWRVGTGAPTVEWTFAAGADGDFGEVAFAPDGRTVAATAGGAVLRWDRATGAPLPALAGGGTLAFSPDSTTLATGGLAILLWRAADGVRTATLRGAGSNLNALAFSPDGRYVAAGGGNLESGAPGRDHAVRLWRVADGALVATWRGHQQPVTGLAFSADGRLLYSGSWDRTIRIWAVP
jgi:WD40 repeat protein